MRCIMSDYYKYEVFRLPISKTPLCADELEDVVCGVKCDLGKFEIVYTEDEVCLDLVVKELSGDGEYGFSRELLDEERVPIQMCFDAIPDLAGHYTDHGRALYYADAQGNPWTATYIQAKGDVIADLHEDMAAEQKARATYEWLINLTDDHDIKEILKFLRQREIVHFQRFGEALMDVQDNIKY